MAYCRNALKLMREDRDSEFGMKNVAIKAKEAVEGKLYEAEQKLINHKVKVGELDNLFKKAQEKKVEMQAEYKK